MASSELTIYSDECQWKRLGPELVQKIASFCHPNECAGAFRLVDSETSAALRDYKTLTLGLERRSTADVHRAADPWPGHAFVAHWGRPEPWRSLSLPQRERLLCLAASSGHAGSLDAALAQCGCGLKPAVLTAAAAAGNLAGCERLLHEGCPFHNNALTSAAQGGHLPVLQLLLGAFGDISTRDRLSSAAKCACAGGQLPILQRLQQAHGWRPTIHDTAEAALARHIEMMEQLLTQQVLPTCYALSAAAEAASAGGQLPILHWLQQVHGYSPKLDDAVEAAAAGHVAMMEQLLPQVLPTCYAVSVAGGEGATAAAAAGPAAEAGGGVDPPNSSEQAHLQLPRRLENVYRLLDEKTLLLEGIAQGCPVEVLRRHYDRLWRPMQSAVAGADPLPADLVEELRLGMARLLSAAAGSPAPCWAAKVDFLLGSCGPEGPAGQVLRHVCLEEAAQRPDFLARLQHLRAASLPVDARVAKVAARGGHADALAWLWSDECGLPVRAGRDFVEGVVAAARISSKCTDVLALLRERGLVITPGMVAFAAGHIAQNRVLPNVLEAVHVLLLNAAASCKPVSPADGKGLELEARREWSIAFAHAARAGVSLRLLRALRARGAAVDLGAVAMGGSEEALEWAAAELEVERGGGGVQALVYYEASRVHRRGNTAALTWLRGRGLLPTLGTLP